LNVRRTADLRCTGLLLPPGCGLGQASTSTIVGVMIAIAALLGFLLGAILKGLRNRTGPSSLQEKTIEAITAGVIKEVQALSGRAEKKWGELDKDGSDTLEGDELLELAAWAWESFNPGEQASTSNKEDMMNTIMSKKDEDKNGVLDKKEFQKFFDEFCASSTKFHKALAKGQYVSAGITPEQIWDLLDKNGDGNLSKSELTKAIQDNKDGDIAQLFGVDSNMPTQKREAKIKRMVEEISKEDGIHTVKKKGKQATEHHLSKEDFITCYKRGFEKTREVVEKELKY